MKKIIAIMLSMAIMLSSSVFAFAVNEERSSAVELIYSFVEATNNKDIDGYISLFTEWNKEAMKSSIKYNSESEFFQEDYIELVNVKELEKSKGLAINVSTEYEMYDSVILFYTEENIKLKSNTNVSGVLENGYNYRVFVIVKESGVWKIERVSTPKIFELVKVGEGFNTKTEQQKVKEQLEKQSQLIEQDISGNTETSLITPEALPTPPINTTIYFTKQANINYHGSTKSSNIHEPKFASDYSITQPMMTYIAQASCNLSITSNGLAYVESNITGYSSSVTSVKIVADLQQYKNGSWVSIKKWTQTANSYRLTLSESTYVAKGYSYRVVSTVTAYSGSNSETRTLNSAQDSY